MEKNEIIIMKINSVYKRITSKKVDIKVQHKEIPSMHIQCSKGKGLE